MENYDVKKRLPALYNPKLSQGFHVVEVPEMMFLQVDGHGDPNVSQDYQAAVQALYTLSYGIRAIAKAELEKVHTVFPLEGLWSAQDLTDFAARNKSAWNWTMMIAQPDWITPQIVEAAKSKAQKKGLAALDKIRFTRFTEGTSVQVLHVGSYDSETPVVAQLHNEYLPAHGLTFNGHHHEIYLSDPRRVEAARLRTILRQPARPLRDSDCG